MDANGESMDRRWQKEIHVLELIIGAPWLLVAQFENRHVSIVSLNYSASCASLRGFLLHI
jgi:hypothetical protein